MDEKPLYLQVEDRLKANIESGAWEPGEQVPGEQILCKQFGVSRVTLRHALANLVNEGLMVKEHGRGTFVADNESTSAASDGHARSSVSFSDLCRLQGKEPSARIVSASLEADCPKEVVSFLGLDNSPAFKLCRVRFSDGRPVLSETNYFRASFAFLAEHDLEGSLYELLQRHGVMPGELTRRIGIVYADNRDAELLKVDLGSALLFNRSFVKDSEGHPLHVADQHAIADDPGLYQFYA